MTCFTAIFSDYDDLKRPNVITPGTRYICFTDQDLKSDIWEVCKVWPLEPQSSIELAREYKILSFHEYEKSIWIDGSFTINCDLNKFWDENFTSPMTVINHPMRDCIYDEGEICIKNNRGNMNGIANQCKKYRDEGVPRNFGLIQSGIILRENTDEVKDFCDLWWDQISLSTRDQIGFAFAEFKTGIKWPRINLDYRTSDLFKFKTHKHRRAKNTNRNI